jgi:hypothetical protein
MGVQPTRANENPHVIPAYRHAMACPYSGRRRNVGGRLAVPGAFLG